MSENTLYLQEGCVFSEPWQSHIWNDNVYIIKCPIHD